MSASVSVSGEHFVGTWANQALGSRLMLTSYSARQVTGRPVCILTLVLKRA